MAIRQFEGTLGPRARPVNPRRRSKRLLIKTRNPMGTFGPGKTPGGPRLKSSRPVGFKAPGVAGYGGSTP